MVAYNYCQPLWWDKGIHNPGTCNIKKAIIIIISEAEGRQKGVWGNTFPRAPLGQPRSGGGWRDASPPGAEKQKTSLLGWFSALVDQTLRISNLSFIEGLLQIQAFIDRLDRLIETIGIKIGDLAPPPCGDDGIKAGFSKDRSQTKASFFWLSIFLSIFESW